MIPASVMEVGVDAFYNCKRLKRVVFAPGSRLERIRCGCFRMTGLKRIAIPRGVARIERIAFCCCENLQEVVFEEGSGLETIEESAFKDCTKLAKINLPDGLRSIERYAFLRCGSLQNVQLPSTLEKIGNLCFGDSGLKMLVLPAGMREVGTDVFWGCKRLETV